MKRYLSESTLYLIEEMGITQQEIAAKINELYEKGKCKYPTSQQSISRYINGYPYYKEDTEKVIIEAIRIIAGVKKYSSARKLYAMRKEKEEEKQRIKLKKEKWSRPSEKRVLLRDIWENEMYRQYLPTEDDLIADDVVRDYQEKRLVLSFFRNASIEIQRFFLDIMEFVFLMDPFMRETFACMLGIQEEQMLDLMCHYAMSYSGDSVYLKLEKEFSNEQILGLSKLMYAAAMADESRSMNLAEDGAIYQMVYYGNYDWPITEVGEDEELTKEEALYLECFINSRLSAEVFVELLAYSVFLERYDWLMLHQAYLLHEMQKGNRVINKAVNLSVTETEDEFLDDLDRLKNEELNKLSK